VRERLTAPLTSSSRQAGHRQLIAYIGTRDEWKLTPAHLPMAEASRASYRKALRAARLFFADEAMKQG
jgi:hypothetical protein